MCCTLLSQQAGHGATTRPRRAAQVCHTQRVAIRASRGHPRADHKTQPPPATGGGGLRPRVVPRVHRQRRVAIAARPASSVMFALAPVLPSCCRQRTSAGRPTCAQPAARRDRGETSKLSAACALAPALPGCCRQKARAGRPTCVPPAARHNRGETSKLSAARAPLPGCGRRRGSSAPRRAVHV